MFGTFFKSSIKALPWLVLIPIGIFVCYWTFILNFCDTYFTVSEDWFEFGPIFVRGSMIAAIAVNFVFLMIIPPAFGGLHTGKKRFQFYLGFFVNLAFMLVLPVIAYSFTVGTIDNTGNVWSSRPFIMDTPTFIILIAVHGLMFLLPYILGALFVAPAYAKAFWFADRGK